MKNNTMPIESLIEKAEDYSKTTIELFQLNAIDKTADLISTLVTRLVIFMAVVLFTLTTNIGIALWIGELTGKTYYGFFIVGGFYVLITILLYNFMEQWIKTPVSNSIITHLIKMK
jgi:hypothetical protein